MTAELKPAAWANQLIKVWRDHRPASTMSEYPISIQQLITGYINPKFQNEQITVEPCQLDSVEGFLVRNRSGWTIGYNQAIEHKGRVNFTLAHELGHYLCHRKLQSSFQCGQGEMMDTGKVNVEREANEFAANLLMPYDDYRKEVEGKKVTVEVISDCAAKYETSWTAAAFHWLKFTNQKAMFVHSRDGFVIRAHPSKAARKAGIYLGSGHEIHSDALTLQCEKTGNTDETRKGVLQPATVWHPELAVLESAMFSRKFNDWSYTILLYQ